MFGLLLAIGALSAQTTAQTHILRSMGVANYPPLAYAARTQGTLKLSVKLKETRALFRCEQHFPSTIIDRSSRAENDDEALHDTFSRARQRVRKLVPHTRQLRSPPRHAAVFSASPRAKPGWSASPDCPALNKPHPYSEYRWNTVYPLSLLPSYDDLGRQ